MPIAQSKHIQVNYSNAKSCVSIIVQAYKWAYVYCHSPFGVGDLQYHTAILLFGFDLFYSLHFHLTGVAIEAVSDSSRYFVVRVVDDNGKY